MENSIRFNRYDGVSSLYDTPSNYDSSTGGHLVDFDLLNDYRLDYPGEGGPINQEMLEVFAAVKLAVLYGNPAQAKYAYNALRYHNSMLTRVFGGKPFLTAYIPYSEENAARLCDAIRECFDAMYNPNNNDGAGFLHQKWHLM